MDTRICNNCGEMKAFDASEWRMCRGVPAGTLCKKCIALKKKMSRQEPGALILELSTLNINQLSRIGKCITLLSELSSGTREPIDQIEDRLVTELRYSSLNAVCIKYIREILSGTRI